MYRHPSTRSNQALSDHGAIGSGKSTSQTCSRHVIQGGWQRDEIHVRMVERYQLGKRSPIGEARLTLVITYLVIPCHTLLT